MLASDNRKKYDTVYFAPDGNSLIEVKSLYCTAPSAFCDSLCGVLRPTTSLLSDRGLVSRWSLV